MDSQKWRMKQKLVSTKSYVNLIETFMPGAIMGDPTHDKVMGRRPETQGCSGYKGPSGLTPASTPPCNLALLLLSLLVLLRIFALPAESSPAPLSLN